MKLQLDSIRPGVPHTESVHLPSLRRLNLGYYTIKADFMAKLLPGCPNLKKLVLHACRLKLSHMSFSSLTSLFIDGSCSSTDIRVSIPSLQYLKITVLSCQTAEIVFEHMPSLAEACVCFLTAGDFPRSFYNRKASILNSLSGVKNLDVVLHGSEAQGMMTHALKDCPQFRNLKVLHFECFDVCLLGCVDIIGWLWEHSEKLTDLSFYQDKDGSDKTNIMEQLRVIFDDIKLLKKLEMAECKKARIYESLDKLLEELTVYLRRFVKMEIEILEEKEAEVGLLGVEEEEEEM